MKSRILSVLGISAIALAVACNSSKDESTNTDSASTTTTVDSTSGTSTASADAGIQTYSDGRKYVVRKRSSSSASGGSGTSSTSAGTDYDTVWLYMGTQDRYYTLHGSKGRDTLYYNTDEWNSWWNNTETDNELKSKSGNVKVKVDDDGSWKVKNKATGEKTKQDEDGKVKTKPKG